jgi:hypothetical protein
MAMRALQAKSGREALHQQSQCRPISRSFQAKACCPGTETQWLWSLSSEQSSAVQAGQWAADRELAGLAALQLVSRTVCSIEFHRNRLGSILNRGLNQGLARRFDLWPQQLSIRSCATDRQGTHFPPKL